MKKFLLLLLLLLTSCRTTRYVPLPEVHTRDSLVTRVNTRVDSIREYVRDSMSIRMVSGTAGISGTAGPSPDTVYIDRWHTAYKDRWRVNARVDTIRLTTHDSIPYPVEVPIEVPTPIPRFYKNCTLGFFLLFLALLAYIALRIYLRR